MTDPHREDPPREQKPTPERSVSPEIVMGEPETTRSRVDDVFNILIAGAVLVLIFIFLHFATSVNPPDAAAGTGKSAVKSPVSAQKAGASDQEAVDKGASDKGANGAAANAQPAANAPPVTASGPSKSRATSPDDLPAALSAEIQTQKDRIKKKEQELQTEQQELRRNEELKAIVEDYPKQKQEIVNLNARLNQELQKLARREQLLKGMQKGELTLDLGNGESMTFVYVPAIGQWSYPIGRTEEEAKKIELENSLFGEDIRRKLQESQPRHFVVLNSGYFVGKHEVTNFQYAAFNSKHVRPVDVTAKADAASLETSSTKGSGPSAAQDTRTNPGRNEDSVPAVVAAPDWESLPVTRVTWIDASRYAENLKQHVGFEVRLPTEIEWEIAARGKDGDRFGRVEATPFDDSIVSQKQPQSAKSMKDITWCRAVGMFGNVSEWCLDDWDDAAYRERQQRMAYDPVHPLVGQPDPKSQVRIRVVRGGAFGESPANHEAAQRRSQLETNETKKIGFRLVLIPN